jgi:transcriptional regulator with XRE-family HTH domain
MDVSRMLRELRHRAQLTQVALAERIGVSQATISHVEKGGATTTDVLARWVEACGGTLAPAQLSDDLERAAAELSDGDRAMLARVALALPRIPDDIAKRAIVDALARMAGLTD